MEIRRNTEERHFWIINNLAPRFDELYSQNVLLLVLSFRKRDIIICKCILEKE